MLEREQTRVYWMQDRFLFACLKVLALAEGGHKSARSGDIDLPGLFWRKICCSTLAPLLRFTHTLGCYAMPVDESVQCHR